MCRSFIRRSVIKNEPGEFTVGSSRIGRRLLASQDSFFDGAQLQAYAFTLQQKYRVFSTIIPPPNAPPRFAISFQCARAKSHASFVPAGFRITSEITCRLSCERTSGEIAYSKVLSSSLGSLKSVSIR